MEKGGNIKLASFKPEMSSASAETYIQNLLKRPVYDVQAIELGELSKVFSYNDQGIGYVIHFNNIGDGFEKVQYVYEITFHHKDYRFQTFQRLVIWEI